MTSPEEHFSDRAIVKTARVAAPRDQVWQAWTNETELTRWFCRDAKVELRPDGPYEMYFLMDQPAGSRGGEGNTIQSFRPGRLLAFTWNAPPSFGPLRKPRTHVLLTLDDLPGGGTQVVLTHYGWRTEDGWDKVYAYFDNAWTHVLGSLTQHFGGTSGPG